MGGIINEFLGSSAAVVSGGLGFNPRIAVFVFLFLFGLCILRVSLFVLVLGSNPVQCASWCFVFVMFLIFVFGGFVAVPGCTRDQVEIRLRSG